MRPATLDPTAGERARAIRERPVALLPILDPTDPRYRELRLAGEDPATDDTRRIVDPTDPDCGKRPA